MRAIIITITLLANNAHAVTDWACFYDCRDAGYSYGYCVKICDY